MTKEEAHIELCVAQADIWYRPSDDAIDMAIKALEQKPCEAVAKERYKDLCEYFGGAKDILKHREDFKAWLGRVKWHIHKAEELSAENDDLRDQLAMRDRFQEQEPCEDCISRAEARQKLWDKSFQDPNEALDVCKIINELPSIQPKPKTDVLDKIRAEIEHLTITEGGEDYVRTMAELYSLKIKVLQIIDKYKAESEENVK